MGATLDSRAEHDNGHALQAALQAHPDVVRGEDRIRHREPQGLQRQLDFDAGDRHVGNRAALDVDIAPVADGDPAIAPLAVDGEAAQDDPDPGAGDVDAVGPRKHGDAGVHPLGGGDRNVFVDRDPAVSAQIDDHELAAGIGDAECCTEGTARRHSQQLAATFASLPVVATNVRWAVAVASTEASSVSNATVAGTRVRRSI